METNSEKARVILNWFLEKWDVANLNNMTLREYVTVDDPNTFVQFVEHRTKQLGSINGQDSSKFGIWERKRHSEQKKRYTNAGKYSWRKNIPFNNPEEAFEAVKKELLLVINAAREGKFYLIDNTPYLSPIFKWKVAYLYSNERLISVFSRDVLQRIGRSYGLSHGKKLIPVSLIQAEMIARKPFSQSIYEYSNTVFQQYATSEDKGGEEGGIDGNRPGKKRKHRRAAESKNTTPFIRKGTPETLVTQEHNRLQLLLEEQLISKFGREAVQLEHNFVDIKVETGSNKQLYEVKSAAYASTCVEEALGQILRYAHDRANGAENATELFVAGKYPPNFSDEQYIQFVQQQIKIPFSYIAIEQR